MRLEECPQILAALVAHCCVFGEGNFCFLFILFFLDSNYLETLYLKDWTEKLSIDLQKINFNFGIEDENIKALLPKFVVDSQFKSLEKNFLNEKMDLKDSFNWRIFQILSILRNLSFEEINKPIMASSLPLLK